MLISEFLNDLMPRLPGADESIVESELLAGLREFCDVGMPWVYNYGPVTIEIGSTPLTIVTPENTTPLYWLRTEFKSANGNEFREFPAYLALPPNPTDTAEEPKGYYANTPAQLAFYPEPTVQHPDGFRGGVTLIPTDATTALPEVFGSMWKDAVMSAVLYRMYSMPNKPWSSAQAAVLHGRKFRNEAKRARDITKRRYSTATAGWRFPYFAAQ